MQHGREAFLYTWTLREDVPGAAGTAVGAPAPQQPRQGPRTCVVIVDPQNDFIDPAGSLCVSGAVDDSARLVRVLTARRREVADIVVTLDTHQRLHIAHPLFWVNGRGEHPKPFVFITVQDVEAGFWMPANSAHKAWARYYVGQLAKGGRFQLTIWPEHCLVGSWGHGVYKPVMDAILQWEGESARCANYVVKGNNAFTEHYSAMRAEVSMGSDPNSFFNESLFTMLLEYDRVVVAGQAKSHCVNFTVRDLVGRMNAAQRAKVYLAKDGCSSVTGFEASGDAFLKDMEALGVHVVPLDKAFD